MWEEEEIEGRRERKRMEERDSARIKGQKIEGRRDDA